MSASCRSQRLGMLRTLGLSATDGTEDVGTLRSLFGLLGLSEALKSEKLRCSNEIRSSLTQGSVSGMGGQCLQDQRSRKANTASTPIASLKMPTPKSPCHKYPVEPSRCFAEAGAQTVKSACPFPLRFKFSAVPCVGAWSEY